MLISADDYFPIARRFEGNIEWLYLDTAGEVTIGIGHMIPSAAAMSGVPMVNGAGAVAAEAEKQTAFNSVKAARDKVGQTAGVFESLSTLRLAQDGDKLLFQGNFETLFGEAQVLFRDVAGGFSAWPKQVQLATFDMAFNLGPSRLYRLFPTFREQGLAKRDYAVCAKECKRGGIGQVRNDWTKAQFEQADSAAR